MLTIEIQGLDQVQQRLQTIVAQIVRASGPALFTEGDRILGFSAQLVPVDTGNLKGTAHVTQPQQDGSGLTVELSYGGHGQAGYATIQHEDTSLNHPHGGQSHYLSEPFFAATASMLERLAADIRAGMGG